MENKMYIVTCSINEVIFINIMSKTMLVLQKMDKNGWNGTKMSNEAWNIYSGNIDAQQPGQEETCWDMFAQ